MTFIVTRERRNDSRKPIAYFTIANVRPVETLRKYLKDSEWTVFDDYKITDETNPLTIHRFHAAPNHSPMRECIFTIHESLREI